MSTDLIENAAVDAAPMGRTPEDAGPALDDPSLYINRELSWLDFNARVLEESLDPTTPLLERLKFLAIFASNLDEFFMVRVATLKQKIASGITTSRGGDRMRPREVLRQIARRTHEMVRQASDHLHDDLLGPLAEEGVRIMSLDELADDERAYVDELFEHEIFPVLTPLAVDPSHPFPHLLNGSLNLAVRLKPASREESLFALVQVPSVLPRYLVMPGLDEGHRLLPLEKVIGARLGDLFGGMTLTDSWVFRVTRDSDFDLDDYEEIKDLIETIERQIRERRRGAATRLEIEQDTPDDLIEHLREALDLYPADVYRVRGPLDLRGLFELYALPGTADLKYEEVAPRAVPEIDGAASLWAAIREQDILVHHPYDSFKPVVDFVRSAAVDPNVLAIKQTLYRTSSESPVITALQEAADRGKQVTALVELKARLDEERNIAWARELEKAGVHVVYGFVGLKTHCKVCLVVRRDEDGIRRYVHLGTGNYNPQTARVYTDVGVFTCDEAYADDASALFNYLTGYSELPDFQRLILAPSRLRDFLIESIDAEAGLGERGRIVAKVNSVLEKEVIQALYRASRAGVQIDLICRGICGLRPGVAGVSDNVRVVSIVDRFLEHSRIYHFGGGGAEKTYIASADWMDRNIHRRIEVVVPVTQPDLRRKLDNMLAVSLHDTVKARRLLPDGSWRRVPATDPPLRSQQYFLKLHEADLSGRPPEPPVETLSLAPPPHLLDLPEEGPHE